MAVRTPLLLDAPDGEPQFQIFEMGATDISNIHAFAPYAYGNNSSGPSAKLEVNTANGTLMSGQPFVDTYYIAGTYTTRVDRYSTEAETPNISMSTDNYNRLRVVYDSVSLPTGDTNNLQYPLYLWNDGTTTQLRTMSNQDFIDTFVQPALNALDIWSASTTNQQQGTYFLTTSASPANATLVSATPVAVNSEANIAAYTSGGIPEAQKQTIDTNYYLAQVNYAPTSYAVWDNDIGRYDLPLYYDAGTENIRQHTATTWANLLGPFLRYYLATSGSGYDIIYSLSSGNQRGSTYTDTRVTPTGTGYTTRFVNSNDYRTQEFPTGTASTISANTKRFYIDRGGVPSYGASVNPTGSVDEGQVVTFTLTTTNVLDGTTFNYAITGITAADISSGSLTGTVTISSGTGSTTITLVAADGTENETATCTFTTPGGNRVASVTVNDIAEIPSGTFTGDSAPDDTVDSQLDEVSSAGETVSPVSSIRFRFSRQNIGGTSGFRITVEEGNAGAISNWYNTSAVATSLTTTPVTLYENTNAVPTEIMIEWTESITTQAGTTSSFVTGYTESTWTSTPSDATEIAALFTNQCTAGAGGFSELINSYTINFWGRASGYNDTLLASFVLNQQTSADASGF